MGILPIISNIDDIAEAIDSPPPNRPIERRIGEQGRKICDAFSNVPDWVAALSVGVVGGIYLVCEPYWDDEGIDPPTIDPPFTGGQCPVSYFVNFNVTEYATDGSVTSSGPAQISAVGPIGGLAFANSGCGPVLGPLAPGAQGFCAFLSSGTGSQLAFGNGNGGLTASIVSVQRIDGQPDNCGNPDPEIKPGPNPSPRNPPIPPDERPYDDPTEGPTIPLPPIIIDPDFPPFDIPDFPFGGGGGAGGGPGPAEPGDPTSTGEPGGGGPGGGGSAEGGAEPGQELVGLLLELQEAPPRPREYGDGIYVGAAYIYMGNQFGLDQDFGGSQIRDGQFFLAERDGLTKWRVDADLGYTWLVTPYYREVEA